MKRLIILRHAKSSWASPQLSDFERPLNERGERDAPLIGAWLHFNNYLPDFCLCSTARRTRSTRALLGFENLETRMLDGLYHASDVEMQREIIKHGEGNCLLVVGHNPGISALASELLREPSDNLELYRFPTASCAVIDLPIFEWYDIDWQTGKLVDFTTPHLLADRAAE